MGTRFRTMLAPINRPTGDGRRFADGAVTLAPTPFPFEWVRERTEGHHGAVSIGVVQEAVLCTVGEAIADGYMSQDVANRLGLDLSTKGVFGRGELFDDADRETMAELAEDVATAMHLAEQGVLGPSVDPDSFEGVPVRAGTDTPVTFEDMLLADERGEEIKLELLITSARVRAATLVSIPAFVETSAPLELVEPETAAEPEPADVAALVASVAPTGWRPAAELFEPPAYDGLTDFTIDYERGIVFGHIAPHGTCHVGYQDTCVTPPLDPAGGAYAWFHRHPVETEDGGIVWAGRLTAGGRHPVLNLTASQAMAQYDGKEIAAYLTMREDEWGLFACGPLNPELSEGGRAILSRRKWSGDWREFAQGLGLIEVLALPPGPRQHSEPGFPVATYVRDGRQTALTASFGFEDTAPAAPDFTAQIRAAMRAEAERERAVTALRDALDADTAARTAEARAALAAEMGMIEGSDDGE